MSLLSSPPPKDVPEVVRIYLSGWSGAGGVAAVSIGVFLVPPALLLLFVAGSCALGLIVGAFASRRACRAFREGRSSHLLFPRARRWAFRGLFAGYLTGAASMLVWDFAAPGTRSAWLSAHSSREGLYFLGFPCVGYLVGMLLGFLRARRDRPPDVSRVFE